MKTTKKLLVTLLVAMLFLTNLAGCTQKEGEQETQGTEEQTGLQLLAGYNSASTEDGFYYVENLGDGFQLIRYVNYETQEDTVFCNVQGCTHNNIDCPAGYHFEVGGVSVFVYNSELYVVCKGGAFTVGADIGLEEVEEPGFIKKMDLNGENEQMLVTLPAGHMMISGIYASGQDFYFFIRKNEIGEEPYTLIHFDEFGLTETDAGAWGFYPGNANGTKIYFMHNFSPYGDEEETPEGYVFTTRWHSYDVETGEITKSEFVFDSNEGDAQCINGYFVYYDSATHEITKTSVSTGETEIVAQIEVEENVNMVTFSNIYGDCLELTLHYTTVDENGNLIRSRNVEVVINIETGEVHYPQLINVEGTEDNSDIGTVFVLAETETQYLVANREIYGRVSNTFALIDKEDFWSNTPNFIIIERVD